ncbi:MAG: hypothetical protein HZB33_12685 [Nitrospirae bacterium]|nr:hypothetical protein [Nitrospirota bacterium]
MGLTVTNDHGLRLLQSSVLRIVTVIAAKPKSGALSSGKPLIPVFPKNWNPDYCPGNDGKRLLPALGLQLIISGAISSVTP